MTDQSIFTTENTKNTEKRHKNFVFFVPFVVPFFHEQVSEVKRRLRAPLLHLQTNYSPSDNIRTSRWGNGMEIPAFARLWWMAMFTLYLDWKYFLVSTQ